MLVLLFTFFLFSFSEGIFRSRASYFPTNFGVADVDNNGKFSSPIVPLHKFSIQNMLNDKAVVKPKSRSDSQVYFIFKEDLQDPRVRDVHPQRGEPRWGSTNPTLYRGRRRRPRSSRTQPSTDYHVWVAASEASGDPA
ncbi:hypothetical protein DdX_00212 [Ditylenchus destructor]|uniref:Uncharacterized protein n=1 Tax=Ditylenchus destructor TaxID=166010 RepID=A0AAD4RCS6_9BILA|nr:hypothetical protein DdX_00212 [Ditylenchus destructor]